MAMMRYVSYLRVSTQRQGQSGLGVEAQRAAVDQFLLGSGGTLIAEFVEVESGSGRARPVLVQSIALARKVGGTLLIAKLDRLARNVAFVSSLMEAGVEFVAADAPYANRLMIHILAAFAEHERSLISERTKVALAAAKVRGVSLGLNGKLLAERHRNDALIFARSLSSAVEAANDKGLKTLSELSMELNSLGLRTRHGADWSPGTVHRLRKRLCQTDVRLSHQDLL
jgi:DNA invertase Pin-like site-specific DNA recombinase